MFLDLNTAYVLTKQTKGDIIMLINKTLEDNKMKRYDLVKVIQKDKEFFVLVADPRVIVKLLMNYKSGEEQETQRPWEEKRVREIAKYVSGKFKDDDNKKAILA